MRGGGGPPGGSASLPHGVDGDDSNAPAAFHRRVLDEVPVPVLVLDEHAAIVYANAALGELTGRRVDEALGTNVVDYIHPDDVVWVAEAFGQLVDHADDHVTAGRTQWAPIHVRMVRADGAVIPIEVTGTGLLHDADIRGMVYEIRPAWVDDVVGRIRRGITSGVDVADLLALIVDVVAAPPLDLDAAVLHPVGLGRYEVIVSTSDPMAAALAGRHHDLPWAEPASEPAAVAVSDIAGSIGDGLAGAGFVDLWHVGVESKMTSSTYRLIACSPTHHVPASGVVHRLAQAQELAAVVLLRSQADDLLAHGAFHDPLTQLPNRAGLKHHVDQSVGDTEAVVLYVDLDRFKPVNDHHGHDVGDAVLCEVADRLRSQCRTHDVVARVGGDEFVLVLALDADEPEPVAVAVEAAERIAAAIGGTIDVEGEPVEVSASVGAVVAYPGATTEQLMKLADGAMFVAKRSGGDRAHVHDAAS